MTRFVHCFGPCSGFLSQPPQLYYVFGNKSSKNMVEVRNEKGFLSQLPQLHYVFGRKVLKEHGGSPKSNGFLVAATLRQRSGAIKVEPPSVEMVDKVCTGDLRSYKDSTKTCKSQYVLPSPLLPHQISKTTMAKLIVKVVASLHGIVGEGVVIGHVLGIGHGLGTICDK
jgi:hypothetical protein